MILLNGIYGKISRGQDKSENRTISVIDAGTNTFRLLVAQPTIQGILNPLRIEQRIVRLGEGYYSGGCINPAAEQRAIAALREFVNIAKEYNSVTPYIAGTSIFRTAKNSGDLIEKIRKKLGVTVNVLSEEKEAELSAKGCFSGLNHSKPFLLIDIGGGSTEFIVWRKGKIEFLKSIPLGVVHLTENYIKSDPPKVSELNNLKRIIEKNIIRVYNEIIRKHIKNDFILTGTAGTVTTIGAVITGMKRYDRKKINMLRINRARIYKLYLKLINMTNRERAKLPGMTKGREDLIIAGTQIVLNVMSVFKKRILYVSDYGLLEGLALNFLETKGGEG